MLPFEERRHRQFGRRLSTHHNIGLFVVDIEGDQLVGQGAQCFSCGQIGTLCTRRYIPVKSLRPSQIPSQISNQIPPLKSSLKFSLKSLCTLAGVPIVSERKGKGSKHQHSVSLSEPLESLLVPGKFYMDKKKAFGVPEEFHEALG